MGRRTKFMFRKLVHHPGTKAQPYIAPTMAEVPALLATTFKRKLGNAATPNALAQAADQTVRQVGLIALSRIKLRVPKRSGHLRGSWEMRRVGQYKVELYTNVLYARMVEDGTRPHVIRARRAKALKIPLTFAAKTTRRS